MSRSKGLLNRKIESKVKVDDEAKFYNKIRRRCDVGKASATRRYREKILCKWGLGRTKG